MFEMGYVCPTYVGMNRADTFRPIFWFSMPHVCGDEPIAFFLLEFRDLYAPRMWG